MKQRDEIFQKHIGIDDDDEDWAVSEPSQSVGARAMPNIPQSNNVRGGIT